MLGAFVCVCVWRSQGVCWRRWVLANLTFIIPLASCILPMLNYSKALTCLKLANNTLLRQQWTFLCQFHIFRAWFCFSKYIFSIKLGHFSPSSKQLDRMIHYLQYYSCLYLVELIERIKKLVRVKHLHAWICMKEVILTRSVQALLSGKEGWVANEIAVKS